MHCLRCRLACIGIHRIAIGWEELESRELRNFVVSADFIDFRPLTVHGSNVSRMVDGRVQFLPFRL